MTALLSVPRSRSIVEFPPGVALPSFGRGVDSQIIADRLKSMRTLMSGAVGKLVAVQDTTATKPGIAEQLTAKLASFKRLTATVAMHLDPSWRAILFSALDRLLDPDDWDPEFRLPTEQSFSTFLRMIIYLHPTKRPGLGLSPNGHFLAAWSRANDRIIIECIGNDEVRWVLSRTLDGERESGAGKVLLHRVPDVTAAYDPEVLFQNGDEVLA
jgi:hypothetical protein